MSSLMLASEIGPPIPVTNLLNFYSDLKTSVTGTGTLLYGGSSGDLLASVLSPNTVMIDESPLLLPPTQFFGKIPSSHFISLAEGLDRLQKVTNAVSPDNLYQAAKREAIRGFGWDQEVFPRMVAGLFLLGLDFQTVKMRRVGSGLSFRFSHQDQAKRVLYVQRTIPISIDQRVADLEQLIAISQRKPGKQTVLVKADANDTTTWLCHLVRPDFVIADQSEYAPLFVRTNYPRFSLNRLLGIPKIDLRYEGVKFGYNSFPWSTSIFYKPKVNRSNY